VVDDSSTSHRRSSRVTANVDPKRDILLGGAGRPPDHAPERHCRRQDRIDATHKRPEEGAREWPPEIEMTDEVKVLVDSRWAEYGLHSSSAGDAS
jgi:4-hydroxy-3-polyprenylbenzoate decarboxylase